MDVQAGLRLCCLHATKSGFVTMKPIYKTLIELVLQPILDNNVYVMARFKIKKLEKYGLKTKLQTNPSYP